MTRSSSMKAIHTFGEYLDSAAGLRPAATGRRPHLHGPELQDRERHLVETRSLLTERDQSAHGEPDAELLPPERARMLRGWFTRASTFTADLGVLSREDMEQLVQYVIGNPFRSKRCGRPSRARLRHPDQSSISPA